MSSPTLEQYKEQIRNFSDLSDFHNFLLSLSKFNFPDVSEIRQRKNYIRGCRSPVWITCSSQEGKMFFQIDSDTQIAKGIGKILMDTFNGLTAQEINSFRFSDFADISKALPHERQKGMQIMINQIKLLANNT